MRCKGMMLIVLTILIIAAATAAVLATRRRKPVQSIPERNIDGENLRPLFEPSDESIRALEAAQAKRLKAVENLREKWEFQELLHEKEEAFEQEPTNANASELLRIALHDENAETFIKVSEKISQLWRENRTNLTAQDLADLLDSHFRLLPQQERTSGEIFALRRQIAELRREVRGQ